MADVRSTAFYNETLSHSEITPPLKKDGQEPLKRLRLRPAKKKIWSINIPDVASALMPHQRGIIEKKKPFSPKTLPRICETANHFEHYLDKLHNVQLKKIVVKPKPPSNRFSLGLIVMGVVLSLLGAALTVAFGVGIPLLVCGVAAFTGIFGGLTLRYLDRKQYQAKKQYYDSVQKGKTVVKGNTPTLLLSHAACAEKKTVKAAKKTLKKTKNHFSWSASFFSSCLPKRKHGEYTKPYKRPLR